MYQRRLPPTEIITAEFARQLTELSHEIGRQIGVLVNRKGYVEHVGGDATQIVLPVLERARLGQARFNGLRCLHTHLRGEKRLTQDDLTDLALLRLDLMAAIDVDEKTGLPGLAAWCSCCASASVLSVSIASASPPAKKWLIFIV